MDFNISQIDHDLTIPELKILSAVVQKNAGRAFMNCSRKAQLSPEEADDYRRDSKRTRFSSISYDGRRKRYTPEGIVEDKDFLLKECVHNLDILDFASDTIRNDKEFVKEAMKYDVEAFKYASYELRNDPDFVLEMIMSHSAVVFKYASKSLREDKHLILDTFMYQNSDVLKYALDDVKNDSAFMTEAVTAYAETLPYASDRLLKDNAFLVKVISENGYALQFAPTETQLDENFVLIAVSENGLAIKYVKPKWKENDEIDIAAVTQNGDALEFLSDKHRQDKELVLKAVANQGAALQFASESLKKDLEIIKVAITQNPTAINVISSDKCLQKRIFNDPSICYILRCHEDNFRAKCNSYDMSQYKLNELEYFYDTLFYKFDDKIFEQEIFKMIDQDSINLPVSQYYLAIERPRKEDPESVSEFLDSFCYQVDDTSKVVHFKNEEGQDEGGLTRELCEEVLTCLKKEFLYTGNKVQFYRKRGECLGKLLRFCIMNYLSDNQFDLRLWGICHILDPIAYMGVWSTIYPEKNQEFSLSINYQDLLNSIEYLDEEFLIKLLSRHESENTLFTRYKANAEHSEAMLVSQLQKLPESLRSECTFQIGDFGDQTFVAKIRQIPDKKLLAMLLLSLKFDIKYEDDVEKRVESDEFLSAIHTIRKGLGRYTYWYDARNDNRIVDFSLTIDERVLIRNVQRNDDTLQRRYLCHYIEHLARNQEQNKLADLLIFITGSSCVSEAWIQIEICGDIKQLPSAHTCVKQLNIPPYPTQEIFFQKMNQALELLPESGFGFE